MHTIYIKLVVAKESTSIISRSSRINYGIAVNMAAKWSCRLFLEIMRENFFRLHDDFHQTGRCDIDVPVDMIGNEFFSKCPAGKSN